MECADSKNSHLTRLYAAYFIQKVILTGFLNNYFFNYSLFS